MKVSTELEKLLNASIVDGKISEKERTVLISRAKDEGINLDEFDIFIDSKIYQFNIENDNVVGIDSHGRKFSYSKRNQKKIITFILLSFFLTFFIVFGGWRELTKWIDNKKLNYRYSCSSCEDCLSKYNFEGAREYLALAEIRELNFEQEISVVTAESFFWIKQKDYDRALSIVDEFYINGKETEIQILRFSLIAKIVDNFIAVKDFENARLYTLKSSENINLDGINKADNPSAWDEKSEMKSWRSQKAELLSRVYDAEKLLKKK